jgi:hypothetical protein
MPRHPLNRKTLGRGLTQRRELGPLPYHGIAQLLP